MDAAPEVGWAVRLLLLVLLVLLQLNDLIDECPTVTSERNTCPRIHWRQWHSAPSHCFSVDPSKGMGSL